MSGDLFRSRDNSPSVSPAARANKALSAPSLPDNSAMAYDSQSDRIILFGLEETLSYDFDANTWTNMNPGTKPSYREYPGMAYDSQSDRVILFGGRVGGGLPDTWAYDFESNTWTNMNPNRNPGCRWFHSMAYDLQSDRVIMYGGAVGCFEYGYVSGETWAYDFEANEWTYLTNAGPFTWYHAMAYDSQSDRVILFSGDDLEAWAYEVEANLWTNLGPATQPCEWYCAMAYDSQSDRVIMFDGETWAYDFESNTWTNMNPDLQPSWVARHAMAYDSQSDRVILISGDETWAYDFESKTWRKMTPVAVGNFVWTRQFGGSGYEAAGGVAVDPSGVYVASLEAGLRKYDADGNLLWTREGAADVAVDASGVYVAAGASWGSPYLVKYDADGNLLWTRRLGTSGYGRAYAVAVGPTSVYLLGCAASCPEDTSVSSPEFSVWKYDPEGNHLWNRTYGFYIAAGLAVDLSGVYVGGLSRGGSVLLVKYDPEGNLLWTSSPAGGVAWGIAVDGAGVYVAGHTRHTVPGEVNSGELDAFLLKYDPEGNVLWTRQFGTTGNNSAFGATVGPSGVYVVGSTEGALPGQTSAGGVDGFLRKYDGAGNILWTRQFGTSAADEAFRVAVDASGVYVAGDTYGTFPGETSAGEMDAFLGRFRELPEGVPGAPVNLQAIPGDGRVTISWQAPESNGGSPITGYRIYRGTSSGAESFLVELGNVLSHTDSGLTNGVRYYYQVSAFNAIGEGARSAEVSVTVGTVPAAPQNLQAVAGNAQVTLSWQAPASSGNSAITGYKVYRGTSSGSETLFTTVGNVLTYTDSGVTNGQTYYYQVSAVNAVGEGPKSNEVSATPTAPRDSIPPVIAIGSPANNTVVSSTPVTVTGTASDNVAVQTVELSTDGTTWTAASGTSTWSGSVTLHAGTNVIYARATDTSGNRGPVQITVSLQTAGPGPWGLDPTVFAGILVAVGIAIVVGGTVTVVRSRRRRMMPPRSPPPPSSPR